MGAGLSAQAKVKELQALSQKDAMAYLLEAGVSKAEAKVVTKRVREMQTIDAIAVAMLVDGLSGETQDALAALAQGSGLPGSIAHAESLQDEVEALLWHRSDEAVKPIVQNRRIEKVGGSFLCRLCVSVCL